MFFLQAYCNSNWRKCLYKNSSLTGKQAPGCVINVYFLSTAHKLRFYLSWVLFWEQFSRLKFYWNNNCAFKWLNICHPGLNRLYDWRAIKNMFYLQLSFYTKINRSRLIATLTDGHSSVFFAHKFWFWGNFYPGGVGWCECFKTDSCFSSLLNVAGREMLCYATTKLQLSFFRRLENPCIFQRSHRHTNQAISCLRQNWHAVLSYVYICDTYFASLIVLLVLNSTFLFSRCSGIDFFLRSWNRRCHRGTGVYDVAKG